jgi:hypothetical protein
VCAHVHFCFLWTGHTIEEHWCIFGLANQQTAYSSTSPKSGLVPCNVFLLMKYVFTKKNQQTDVMNPLMIIINKTFRYLISSSVWSLSDCLPFGFPLLLLTSYWLQHMVAPMFNGCSWEFCYLWLVLELLVPRGQLLPQSFNIIYFLQHLSLGSHWLLEFENFVQVCFSDGNPALAVSTRFYDISFHINFCIQDWAALSFQRRLQRLLISVL